MTAQASGMRIVGALLLIVAGCSGDSGTTSTIGGPGPTEPPATASSSDPTPPTSSTSAAPTPPVSTSTTATPGVETPAPPLVMDAIDISPRFSPDGTHLVFASDREGSMDLYEADLATSEVRRLTNTPETEADPTYTPDGDIVFVARPRAGSPWSLYRLVDGTRMEIMGGTSSSAFPDVSATGEVVLACVLGGSFGICGVDLDGSNPGWIVDDPQAVDWEPVWSPDAEEIAFVSDRDGDDEIYIVDHDGNGVRKITDNDVKDSDPAWSPDGTRIAFSSQRDGTDAIWIMNADGTDPQRLTAGVKPAWSPDGRTIAHHAALHEPATGVVIVGTGIETLEARTLSRFPVDTPPPSSPPPDAAAAPSVPLDPISIVDTRPLTRAAFVDTKLEELPGFQWVVYTPPTGLGTFAISIPEGWKIWALGNDPTELVDSIAGRDPGYAETVRRILTRANEGLAAGVGIGSTLEAAKPTGSTLASVSVSANVADGADLASLRELLVSLFGTAPHGEITGLDEYPGDGGGSIEVTILRDNPVIQGHAGVIVEHLVVVLDSRNDVFWSIACAVHESGGEPFDDMCSTILRSFRPFGPIEG